MLNCSNVQNNNMLTCQKYKHKQRAKDAYHEEEKQKWDEKQRVKAEQAKLDEADSKSTCFPFPKPP